jgi:uncharacterized tellurite resistance protein B-like protein
MRTYPHNSPQAAARIVALAMLADGNPSKSELDAIERMDVYRQFRLAPEELASIIETCCADLLAHNGLSWDQSVRFDQRVLAQILSEVDDPALRRQVVCACSEVVEADHYVSENEWALLSAMANQWNTHPKSCT